MKLPKPSLTQINSQEPLRSECTETELEYSFIFENLDSKNSSKHKTIKASKPLQVFRSLEALDEFLNKNQDLLELDNAGIAGYISYEGECEIAVYENIEVKEIKVEGEKVKGEELKNHFTIIKPDPKLYIQAVKKCQEYIKEGDIYQANIAHEFKVKGEELKGEEIYKKLKALNPAPYAGYMNFKDYEIISSSPESFLKFSRNGEDWQLESSPIKGTAKLNELNSLMESSKERAEHIMIVDLIRNDLGRICKPGSIKADELMSIHKFKNLYHYISTVEGTLSEKEQINSIPKFSSIFKASFPGGSITGTPKIRCMEIIKELESTERGLFTGSMGYFKFKDGGEFNILIRTIIHNKKTNDWSFHTGSGITAYSDPEKELEETYLKAEKIAEVFGVKF